MQWIQPQVVAEVVADVTTLFKLVNTEAVADLTVTFELADKGAPIKAKFRCLESAFPS